MTTIPEFLARLSGGDTPQAAVAGARCLLPPIGCGQPLTDGDLPDQETAREWQITGLCADCQAKVDAAGNIADAAAAKFEADCQTLRDAMKGATSDADRSVYALDLYLLAHPEACHTADDYPGWTPGGAA